MVCGGANRDGYRWSEGISRWLRVWGRGRRWQQVCILAVGRDTAVERGGCDDCHGREVKKKVMFGDEWCCVRCACLCVLVACFLLPPPFSPSAVIKNIWLKTLFPDTLVPLIEIVSIYLKKLICLNCLTVVNRNPAITFWRKISTFNFLLIK
jgi:hypothetical protein